MIWNCLFLSSKQTQKNPGGCWDLASVGFPGHLSVSSENLISGAFAFASQLTAWRQDNTSLAVAQPCVKSQNCLWNALLHCNSFPTGNFVLWTLVSHPWQWSASLLEPSNAGLKSKIPASKVHYLSFHQEWKLAQNSSDLGLEVPFTFRTSDSHVNMSEKEIEKFLSDGCHSIKACHVLPQLCWCTGCAPWCWLLLAAGARNFI